MIVSVGVDVAEVERIQRAVDHPRWGERFRRRAFTAAEIEYCGGRKRHAESFAARWAAKEAVMKALGTGFRGVAFAEVEVVRGRDSAPQIHLHARAQARAAQLGITHWHLSLTHSASQAIAFVVAERRSAETSRG
jgi:holo-[acyl-carrier protein] synthase